MPVLTNLFQNLPGATLFWALWCGAALGQSLELSPPDDALAERVSAEARVLTLEEGATAGDLIATARGDYRRILAALYDAGYFGATVSITLAGEEAQTLSTISPPARLEPVFVRVELGPQFALGRAEIGPLAPGTTLPDTVQSGAIARTGAIRDATLGALDDWRAASHARAEVAGQSITARHRSSELDVDITITPGPAFTFGTLIVPSNSPVRARRVESIAGLPTGDPYDPAELQSLRNRLVGTGTFDAVVLRERDAPGDVLDIELELTAAKPRRIGFGAELESTAGLSLEAFWLHRNALGGAERLRFDAAVSGIGGVDGGIDFSLGAVLQVPGFRRADDTLELSAAFESVNEVNYDETLFELGLRRARKVSDTLEVGTLLGLRASEATDSQGTRQFRHVVLSADATRDLRDSPLDPRRGTYGALEVKPFLGFGGSQSGIRVEGDFRAYRALGDTTVIAGRFQLGSLLLADRAETPPSFLFFSGGGGTVRGQGFQSLGVEVAGDVTGGRGFAGLSLEFRREVSETFGVVGFIDYGFVSESPTFEDGSGQAGAGIGLRYNTGIGPLRVDLGVPIGGASDDDTAYGLYIGLGHAF